MGIDKNMSEKELFNIKPDEYGENYKEHFVEQYKVYINGIEKISDRRQNANNHFLGFNTAIIALLSLSFEIDSLKDLFYFRIAVLLLGISVSIIFWYLIHSYKQLNTAKFKILHEIEKKMPMYLYGHEWDYLGHGNDKSKYYPFSHIELLIPVIAGLLYCISLLAILIHLFCQ